MSLTTKEKEDIINTVNTMDLPIPELTEGDIIWWPQGTPAEIKAGNSLKLIYKDGKWEENSDQVHGF